MAKFLVCVFLVVLVTVQSTHGRYLSRQKRVSDQRLAELETLLALSKYRGMLSTVPIGFGKVDPHELGRRRRSASQLWRELVDDNNSSDGVLDDADDVSEEEGAARGRGYYGDEYQLVKDRRQPFGKPELWGRSSPNI